MSLLALMLALDAHASPLEITITDSQVIAVVLECGTDTKKAVVKNGLASFPEAPKGSCEVHFVRRSGSIGGPGEWTCGLDGCTQKDVHHLDVSNAPGRVNIIVTKGVDPSASLEITCPGGYRERAPINDNTATFEGVPEEDCLLHFKGGTPGKFSGMKWGTWYCSLTGTTAVCTMR